MALYHHMRKGVLRKWSANTYVVTLTRRLTCSFQHDNLSHIRRPLVLNPASP